MKRERKGPDYYYQKKEGFTNVFMSLLNPDSEGISPDMVTTM